MGDGIGVKVGYFNTEGIRVEVDNSLVDTATMIVGGVLLFVGVRVQEAAVSETDIAVCVDFLSSEGPQPIRMNETKMINESSLFIFPSKMNNALLQIFDGSDLLLNQV